MQRKSAFIFFLLVLTTVPALGELYPKLVTLTVQVKGLKSSEGSLVLELFDSKDRWMRAGKAVVSKRVKAEAGTMVVALEAPAGRRYALSVHHDINDNGKVDTGFPIPKPTEPVGASNFTGNSIPRFYNCSFRLNQEPMEIAVELRRP